MDKHSSDRGPAGGPEPGSPPRWVKGLGIAGAVLVVLFVILHLTGLTPDHHVGHPFGHGTGMMGAKAARP